MDKPRRDYYLRYIYRKSDKAAIRKRLNKEKAVAYKGGKCEKCGGIFLPCVFDFHHKDPSDKETTGSTFLCWNWDRMKTELDKCSLLCANCHREEHYQNEQESILVSLTKNKKGNQMNEHQIDLAMAETDFVPVDALLEAGVEAQETFQDAEDRGDEDLSAVEIPTFH